MMVGMRLMHVLCAVKSTPHLVVNSRSIIVQHVLTHWG